MSAERKNDGPETLRLEAGYVATDGVSESILIDCAIQWEQERSDAEALRERNEVLERERDILKAYSNWAKGRIRLLKGALDYLAIDCESGMIEQEAGPNGLLTRAEHDQRIAARCRRAIVTRPIALRR